jgi:predicted amidohydrolase YtcJ
VESINPLYGFYAAVARKDQKGWPEQGFQTENKLSRKEALKAMTIWAAKGSFVELERGSLEPGKFADFVVLDRDIMKVPEDELYKAGVLMTFINGEVVYHSKN